MKKKMKRREFLEIVGLSLGQGAAAAVLVGVPREARASKESQGHPGTGYNWEEHDYAYLIDTRKCIGCGMCVRACKRENDVPDDFYRTWVERYLVSGTGEGRWAGMGEEHQSARMIDSPKGALDGFQPVVTGFRITKGFFVPKMCNHCRNTPCTQVCPVGASYQTKDGAVLVDATHCVGCGYCVQACPYGSRYLHPKTHTADKCTWCYHRLARGLKPACVEACPTGARQFGDMKKEDDPVRITLSTERIDVLQPELLTKPNCYYIGLDKEVR